MGNRLYDIAAEIRSALEAADDGGELGPAELAALDGLGLGLDSKVNAYCALIREWESFVAVRKAEVERLRKGVAAHEANIRRLKEHLRAGLEVAGIARHETALHKVWRQRSPASVRFVGADPAALPAEFKRVTVEPHLGQALEHYRATGAAPAGFVVEQAEHLRTK